MILNAEKFSLNRSGKLTLAEQEIMRSHVGKGYRIARTTPELNIVAEPILHHHEHWDGSGYPDGLKQDSIPLLSGIISVVDAYDAMVSDRPYRKGMSKEAACQELRRCAGTQFDPYIVDIFLQMITGSEGTAPAEPPIAEEKIDLFHEKTSLVNAVSCAKYTLGPDERILEVDGQFEELTGYTAYDVAHSGLTQNDMIFEDDRELYWNMVTEQLAHGLVYLEHRIRRKDGTGRYEYCAGLPAVDPVTGEDRTTIIVSDITDSVSVQMQVGVVRNRAMMSLHRLEEVNQRDPLTGLLNRSAFCRACEQELARDGQRSLMLLLDVDGLKKYNDTHSHPQGDELLLSLAQALSAIAGTDGLTGRVGGDEFCCLWRRMRPCPRSEAAVNRLSCRSTRRPPVSPWGPPFPPAPPSPIPKAPISTVCTPGRTEPYSKRERESPAVPGRRSAAVSAGSKNANQRENHRRGIVFLRCPRR